MRSENPIVGIAVDKTGEIICASNGAFSDNEDDLQVRVLNVVDKKWGKKYKIKTGMFSGSNCIMDGYEYDFYYRDDLGVYGYDLGEKKGVKLMDYMASFVTEERTDHMISAADGKFVCNVDGLSEEDSGIAVYKKVDPATVKDRVTITYGGIFIDEHVKTAALDFNRTNENYQIEFIDYSTESEDPITKMNTDIIAGNIPDIIDLNYTPIEQYAKKGLLENLLPYVESDPDIKSDDFIESVWAAMQYDHKLYYVASDFGVDTVIGRTKDVGEETGWTFDELKKEVESHGKNTRAFYSENKVDMLSLFLRNGLMDFVDWRSGECEFQSRQFKDILKFCNDTGVDQETDYTEYRKQMSSLVKEGKQLFVDASGVTLEEIQIYKEMFGEDITFIGYPDENKTGSYFRFNSRVGISAKSEAKDVAWSFVRRFLSKEYQGKKGNMNGTPIRKDCFAMLIRQKMTTEEYIDELGQEIYPISEYWEWDGIGVNGRPLSQQEVDLYIDLVNNTKKSNYSDENIMQMVMEEAERYFKGDKSLDEVADIIQNRVQTYVNESRS